MPKKPLSDLSQAERARLFERNSARNLAAHRQMSWLLAKQLEDAASLENKAQQAAAMTSEVTSLIEKGQHLLLTVFDAGHAIFDNIAVQLPAGTGPAGEAFPSSVPIPPIFVGNLPDVSLSFAFRAGAWDVSVRGFHRSLQLQILDKAGLETETVEISARPKRLSVSSPADVGELRVTIPNR